MPLEKLQKSGFVYIVYRRDHPKDFDVFRDTLEDSVKQGQELHDIVIDLTKDKMLTEGEVGLIARALKKLQGTSRVLRIITSLEITQKLETTNLLKVPNIYAYTCHEALLAAMNKG